MSASVNLAPQELLIARQRRRRRSAWLAIGGVAASVCLGGLGVRWAIAERVAGLRADVAALAARKTEVEQRLSTAAGQRTELLERLRTLAAARQAQPWAARLARLARETPDGVVLTALRVTAAGGSAPPPPAAAPKPAGAPRPAQEKPAAEVPHAALRLTGLALDHGELLRLLSALRGLPGCESAELVRAAQDGQAVQFELECRTREVAP